jgi:hypothetical protein
MSTFPIIASFLENSSFVNGMFRIERVTFLGYSFFRVFHLSSPIIVVALGHSLASFLYKKKAEYFFKCILFLLALYFSSTRANMLASILIILMIYLYHTLYVKKRVTFFIFISCCFIVFTLILVYLLFTDVSNASSNVKYGHVISLNELFKNNINIFLFGNGPGSLYYTMGFGGLTTRSELSYYEVIRIFGISSSVVIFFIFFYPIFSIPIKSIFSFSFLISYLAYLFIAGTNPLLIVPQGFIMLLLAYNYKLNISRKSFE